MPKVSVLMPAYNAEKYINEAIDSILNQTFTDFEFIIIDDGSTDNTVNIINSYQDKRIRLVQNEKNLGVAETLNKGIVLSRGQYIARMDSDDVSLPTRFARQVDYMDSHPDCLICGSRVELFGAITGQSQQPISNEDIKASLLFSSPFAHPTVMMRSDFVNNNHLRYEKEYEGIEDYKLWVEFAIIQGGKMYNFSTCLLRYRVHGNQVTQRKITDEFIQKRKKLYDKIFCDYSLGNLVEYPVFMNLVTRGIDKWDNNLLTGLIQESDRIIKLVDSVLTNYVREYFSSLLFSAIKSMSAKQIMLIIPEYYSKIKPTFIFRMKLCGIVFKKGFISGFATFRAKIKITLNRMKLKNRDFTIISNNCWGGMVYQKYGLQYRTPTVGLYILGHDFVKLCSDLRSYLAKDLIFIPWKQSSYYPQLKDKEPYPVAKLGDIEIYFMHYQSESEATEKWNRRVKRVNPDKLLFKLSQREGCSKEDVQSFLSLPGNKICFSYDEVDGAIVVPELNGLSGDETPIIQHYYNELDCLNKL